MNIDNQKRSLPLSDRSKFYQRSRTITSGCSLHRYDPFFFQGYACHSLLRRLHSSQILPLSLRSFWFCFSLPSGWVEIRLVSWYATISFWAVSICLGPQILILFWHQEEKSVYFDTVQPLGSLKATSGNHESRVSETISNKFNTKTTHRQYIFNRALRDKIALSSSYNYFCPRSKG